MNFPDLYRLFSHTKITPKFIKEYSIERIMVGSGGSEDIIIYYKKGKTDLIAKVFLHTLGPNEKKSRASRINYEIKIFQFLTKKFVLTNRTPHLVGIYNHQTSSNLTHFINRAIIYPEKCLTYEEKLTKNSNRSYVDDVVCDIRTKVKLGIMNNSFDIALLEYCDTNLGNVIHWYMSELNKKPSKNTLNDFLYHLHRILFQLIFTLAIIQEDYPGFCHDDFFCRNILVSVDQTHANTDYVEYIYHKQKFYFPANGYWSKINDFGYSVIVNHVDTERYSTRTKPWQKYHHQNPFNHKIDIFNLLHDIYDGQNLGTESIMEMHITSKIPPSYIKKICQFMNNFIDINIIDKINKNNKQLADNTWHIDKIPLLERTVYTPKEYLASGVFDVFTYRPPKSNIIRTYNLAH